MEKFKFLGKNKIKNLPEDPGIYAFFCKKEILYIGKAVNLKKRVKNHFSRPGHGKGSFTGQVSKIGYIATNSEIEALILEAKLIKKYRPKHNVAWKDDKNYFYVAITKEEYPRIFITHQLEVEKKISGGKSKDEKRKKSSSGCCTYIGPFVDGKSLKQAMKFLRKTFPYRSCKNMPKYPCLWHQLDRCPAPCSLKSLKNKDKIFLLLEKKIKNECQKNIGNLAKILQHGKNQVLKNLEKEMKKSSASQDYETALRLRDQIRFLEKVLAHARLSDSAAQTAGREVNFLSKKQGAKANLWQNKTEKKLRKLLRTQKSISRIEAYDVSNIQGKEAAGSMVTFIKGFPEKNFYRRFKINFEKGPNDTAMIKEVLSRRLKHQEWPYPDLILIDGGRPQLNAALAVVSSCRPIQSGLVSVLALAKKKNELFVKGKKKPILLKSLPREISDLILGLRDESHRFALAYHHKLRTKALAQ